MEHSLEFILKVAQSGLSKLGGPELTDREIEVKEILLKIEAEILSAKDDIDLGALFKWLTIAINIIKDFGG